MSSYTIEGLTDLGESTAREERAQGFPYPINMASFLTNVPGILVDGQATVNSNPAQRAQHALALWNRYCTTSSENDLTSFLEHACWFVENEMLIGDHSGGWPAQLVQAKPSKQTFCLSALTQGCAISVLVRAYRLTEESHFLEVAARASETFAHDILDGGVAAPIGSDGVFFEEVAIYPASHLFEGFIYALMGLYDYSLQTPTPVIERLLERALRTFQKVIAEFDTNFWTYTDLVRRQLTTPAQLKRQIHLLEVLAERSGESFLNECAGRWRSYPQLPGKRLRYGVSNLLARSRRALAGGIQRTFIAPAPATPPVRVNIPLNSLNIGGILTVLRGVVQATEGIWDIEYLTRYTDLENEKHVVHLFGSAAMAPWQYPTIWVYVWDGFWKLFGLMRHGAGYHIFLPQDGVFSAAFSGLVAKVTGARTVAIDHANLTLVDSDIYRAERNQALTFKRQPRRWMSALLMKAYWPALDSIARIAARTVDHFLVPGVVGDGIEEVCQGFGIPHSRLTRFDSMINVERHLLLSDSEQALERQSKGLPANAVVVAIICRLSPEKGLEIALECISQALMALEPADRERLRVVIAGDGPSRQSLEDDVKKRALGETCVFWGNLSSDEVINLLAISHIFLYTSTRGACMPMAVLEAMASECAVIATTQPMGNTVALADERGVIVEPGAVKETADALVRLVSDPLECQRMGQKARAYIAVQHSPEVFRRLLQRATSWSDLDALLQVKQLAVTTLESKANNDTI